MAENLKKFEMKRAFTLVEVTVSIALLVMMLSFALLIFRVSIDAYRVAGANTEITQKMRIITEQLNRDFKGLRKDAPLMIWFHDANDSVNGEPNRFDQIMFFADGDFQSTQLYDKPAGFTHFIPYPTGVTIRGNMARIFYGQAQIDINGIFIQPWEQRYDGNAPDKILNESSRIFARRQHILTADSALDIWPEQININSSFNFINATLNEYKNECYEHDSLSLAKWKMLNDTNDFNEPAFGLNGTIADRCFKWRPLINFNNPDTFHKLMCEGVGSFAVQFIYTDTNDPLKAYDDRYKWFPSNDPDMDGSKRGSHFDSIHLMKSRFGVYFNILHAQLPPPPRQERTWYPIESAIYRYDATAGVWKTFNASFYPKALKFTFRLYDSKGIIKENRNGIEKKGRTFTHIVYLD